MENTKSKENGRVESGYTQFVLANRRKHNDKIENNLNLNAGRYPNATYGIVMQRNKNIHEWIQN